MVLPISAIRLYLHKNDPEYMRIIQEMLALGLTPTGNKEADKATLEAEKKRIAEQALMKKAQTPQNYAESEKLEEQKNGAMALADINKILFGL